VAWTYSYDNHNHMVAAREYSSASLATLVTEADYQYDFFGNCVVETTTNSGESDYFFDGWNPALAKAVGNSKWVMWGELSGGVFSQSLHGDGVSQWFGQICSDEWWPEWFLTDQLGSVVGETNYWGALGVTVAYDAYGNVTGTTYLDGSTMPEYSWAGQRLDAATGLYEMGARFYDPTTGRWTTQDPLGLQAGDSNLYRYVNNNPLDAVDPSGLAALPLDPQQPKQADESITVTGTGNEVRGPKNSKLGPTVNAENVTFGFGVQITAKDANAIKGTKFSQYIFRLVTFTLNNGQDVTFATDKGHNNVRLNIDQAAIPALAASTGGLISPLPGAGVLFGASALFPGRTNNPADLLLELWKADQYTLRIDSDQNLVMDNVLAPNWEATYAHAEIKNNALLYSDFVGIQRMPAALADTFKTVSLWEGFKIVAMFPDGQTATAAFRIKQTANRNKGTFIITGTQTWPNLPKTWPALK